MTALVPSQRAREAAAQVYSYFRDHDFAGWIRNGTNAGGDYNGIIQLFARFEEEGKRIAAQGVERDRYRHKARGTVYEVIASAELQAANGAPEEGAILTIYRGDDGKVWARRASEFGDGRFERLTPDTQSGDER